MLLLRADLLQDGAVQIKDNVVSWYCQIAAKLREKMNLNMSQFCDQSCLRLIY